MLRVTYRWSAATLLHSRCDNRERKKERLSRNKIIVHRFSFFLLRQLDRKWVNGMTHQKLSYILLHPSSHNYWFIYQNFCFLPTFLMVYFRITTNSSYESIIIRKTKDSARKSSKRLQNDCSSPIFDQQW